MNKGAEFNSDKTRRYVLWRIWDGRLPFVAFIGLNPSTANEHTDDPTIRRVVGIAKSLGYGGVYMLNLFTIVSADPKILQDATNWGDWLSDRDVVLKHTRICQDVIFAWGNFKEAAIRGSYMETEIPRALCLQKNKNGSPKHPLYCRADIKPVPYHA